MSVVAVRMWGMAERRSLRRIGDPVVAAAPAGVRLRPASSQPRKPRR